MTRAGQVPGVPEGRVLTYPLVPKDEAEPDEMALLIAEHKSWSTGRPERYTRMPRMDAGGYWQYAVIIDAPPIGGVPIPKRPRGWKKGTGTRARRRARQERKQS